MAHPSSGRISAHLISNCSAGNYLFVVVVFLSLRDHAYDFETIAEKLPDNFKVCLYCNY